MKPLYSPPLYIPVVHVLRARLLSARKPVAPLARQESFSGSEPCAGLTDLLSKTSLDANDQESGDTAHKTPSFSRRGGAGVGGGGAGDSVYSGGSRMGGGGGDQSFSFGDETPRTPRDTASQGVGDNGSRWDDWRRGGGGGVAGVPGGGLDFSTPAAVDRRRGERGEGAEEDRYDGFDGGASFGMGVPGMHG